MPSIPVPFAVASDEAVSKAYTRQRLLNLFAETTPTRAKSAVLIRGRAGLRPWATVGKGPIRGEHEMGGLLYVVSGGVLYKVTSAGAATSLGNVSGGGHVLMADNGFQLAIATNGAWVGELDGYFIWGQQGTSGAGYLYDSEAGTFAQLTNEAFLLPNDGKFQISGINDGASYDALDFATAESSPDELVRGIVDRRDLLLFGTKTLEPWYDSGNSDFPFERQGQTVAPKGIVGPYCIARLDNTVFWIGRDQEAGGGAIVYRLNNYDGERVSTHAVEEALAGVDFTQVRCIAFIIAGHAFFMVILPNATAWVYDAATQLWHEESTYGLARWQGNCHVWAYDSHIIGSYNSGDLYTLDPDYFFDGPSTTIVREMISVPLGEDSAWKVCGKFQIDMETGVGLNDGQGSDPQIMLQVSYDRGRTWGVEKWRSIGKIGEYGIEVIWRQFRRFRSVMLKVRITDPVKVAFINYFADINGG